VFKKPKFYDGLGYVGLLDLLTFDV